MNLSLSSTARTEKLMFQKISGEIYLEDPSSFPERSRVLKKVACESQAEISISRLLDHTPPESRPYSNPEGRVLRPLLQNKKLSKTAVSEQVSNQVSAAPMQAMLTSGSSTFLDGNHLFERPKLGPFRKCLKISKTCSNCHQTHSPNWYLSKDKSPLCNACAKYQKRTGMPRPPQHWNKEVRFRKRKDNRGEHLARSNSKTKSVCGVDRNWVECDDYISRGAIMNEMIEKDLKLPKLTEQETSTQICYMQQPNEKTSFDSETENKASVKSGKQISPRRSKLFEMEQNMRHYQNVGNWDKMTSLLSVVQLAKYQGDLALNLVTS